jgi:uncharacterized membrane protein YkvA (DUF1232 family)
MIRGVYMDITDNQEHFSEESFWQKIKKFGKKAGVSVVYTALLLFFALQNPLTPAWAKAIIIGALGYFILPMDLIADILPGGYADDGGALIGALLTVALYIDDDVKRKAKERIATWFGEDAIEETKIIDDKLNVKDNPDETELE